MRRAPAYVCALVWRHVLTRLQAGMHVCIIGCKYMGHVCARVRAELGVWVKNQKSRKKPKDCPFTPPLAWR